MLLFSDLIDASGRTRLTSIFEDDPVLILSGAFEVCKGGGAGGGRHASTRVYAVRHEPVNINEKRNPHPQLPLFCYLSHEYPR